MQNCHHRNLNKNSFFVNQVKFQRKYSSTYFGPSGVMISIFADIISAINAVKWADDVEYSTDSCFILSKSKKSIFFLLCNIFDKTYINMPVCRKWMVKIIMQTFAMHVCRVLGSHTFKFRDTPQIFRTNKMCIISSRKSCVFIITIHKVDFSEFLR